MTILNVKTTKKVFNRFDIVSDHSDHHYASSHPDHSDHHYASPHPKDISNSNSPLYKRIMKEWKILEQSLPESIFVRVYENRIDLMRAVIVGAAGTPYHDGLFFFDIGLPSDYPNSPPNVNYHSFGLSLNPNLYQSGKVCLSLLNTWSGDKTENWNPKGSTLLQVLLSLQGLVLNENPFFNEPGYLVSQRSFFEGRSRSYNEHAFRLTCQSAVYLIRNPPRKFGKFVKAHFRDRAVTILRACHEYANGRVRVGYYGCCENSSYCNNGSRSEQFNSSMKKLYPDMVETFRSCGAVLDASLKQLVLEEEPPKMKKQVKDEQKSKTSSVVLEEEPPKQKQVKNEGKSKNNRGILKKAVAKIKKVLGWKNSGKDKMTNEL